MRPVLFEMRIRQVWRLDEHIYNTIKFRVGEMVTIVFLIVHVLGKEKIVSDDEKASQCDGGIMTAETTKIVSDDEKASQCDGGIMTAETTNSINESSKPITVGDSVDESDKVPRSKEQTTQMDIKDVNDAHLTEPERTRVLVLAETTNAVNESGKPVTVGDSVDESNKVPRSEEQQTTQMDIKDVNDANLTEPRLDVDVPLIRPRSSSPAVEANKGNKRPALVCEFFAKGWCIKGTSCKFRHIKDLPVDQQNEPQKSQPQGEGVKESMGKSDNLATSATTSTLIACSSNTVTNPPVNKSLGNPFMGPNAHRTSWASFAPKPQEFSGKGYHFGIHNHGYNVTNHDTFWPRAPTFLSSLSQKSNLKSSSYKWEPSKPFRSTFLISQGIYSSDIQYDPIRDSIEQPTKNGDKLSKLSSSSRVPSISGTHTPLQEKLKTDIGSDRVSVGSHVNGNDDDIDMDVDSNEIADTKHEDAKSESKGKRHIGDVIQASEVHASGHYSLQHTDDGPAKEANSYKLDFDAEADMHRESKSVRHFRASLIEFVKELMRPSWRDGKLSKDAHKLIVKRTVDKVLTSLPTEHVPDVQESIDTYLSSSQPKLMKLVEVRCSQCLFGNPRVYKSM
ncbi:putative transcription factor C3H family [Helianthus debilis subsp. tardiflorus]